jgi:ubiquinone/menaquinone biosynthesis C-methylase UbiE
VLHFAPEPVFYPLFKNKPLISYKTADLFLKDVDYREDIQQMNFESSKFDLILCNHVIEHVKDDSKALQEISRILKPSGKAIITIPGDFQRAKTVYFNHLRFNGHYRDYGADVVGKMRQSFSKVESIDMHKFDSASDDVRYGIRQHDMAFVCHK